VADEEADSEVEPTDDDLMGHECPKSTDEDVELAASPQVSPMIISRDDAPSNSSSVCSPLEHSSLDDNSRWPLASISDHQNPDSSSSKFSEDMQSNQDEMMQDLPRDLEPTPFVGADPPLYFNPWN
jgi:hypothetical protein